MHVTSESWKFLETQAVAVYSLVSLQYPLKGFFFFLLSKEVFNGTAEEEKEWGKGSITKIDLSTATSDPGEFSKQSI